MGSMQIVQLEFQAIELEYYKFNSVQVKEDFNSLFTVVQDVLKHSTSVAEKCLLGKNETIIIENNSVPRINCPLNILKQIYCTVACEADSKSNVSISASIVGILSTYSGFERAVLTLAAFALSYGELLYYIDRQQLNSFALLISYLKRVDELIKVQQEDQFKMAISDVNRLTKLTLELVGFVVELDNLSKKECIDDLSVVTKITAEVESYSYLAIQVVVACMKQVNYLTYDRITTTRGLSSLASKLEVQLTNLKETVGKYKLIIAEWEAYAKLHSCFCNRGGIIEAFTCLMYPKKTLDVEFCQTGELVRVDQLLKGKNVLLFISDTDIYEDDFLSLKRIHESFEIKHQDYKIVWIPVVEKWTTKSTQDFSKWKTKMPWYVACHDEPIVGIKYIKKRWQFSYKSMVVVVNSQGAVECLDAMQMIRAWGTFAFPFRPGGQDHCIGPIISSFVEQVEEENYIFLYGGKEEWINEFGEKVALLESHVSSKVSINSFAIGVENSKMEIGQFWTRMESLLYVRMKWNLVDVATKHIQNLLAFQKDDGWALLCKGSTILVCASGTEIKKVVTNYEKWTTYLETKKFEICLEEYLNIVIKQQPGSRPCRHLSIQSVSGWLPVDVECPDCGVRMERVVTYKCCHNNAIENGSL